MSTPLMSFPNKEYPSKYCYSLSSLFVEGNMYYLHQNYKSALCYFKSYLIQSAKAKAGKHFIEAVDKVGQIFLEINKSPDKAIKFFSSISKMGVLTDEELDDVEEWREAALEFKKISKEKFNYGKPNKLYKRGKLFFKKGLKLQGKKSDRSGNAYFKIAEKYLIPFTIKFDKDDRVPEVLYYLGQIKRSLHSKMNSLYLESFYLKEVIRRFPHNEFAWKSWKLLNEDTHLYNSGSSGDNTPKSKLEMLRYYKEQAKLKTDSKQVRKK